MGSLGIELAQVVSAEARISHALVVIVVDMLVPNDAWELRFLKVASSQQSNFL